MIIVNENGSFLAIKSRAEAYIRALHVLAETFDFAMTLKIILFVYATLITFSHAMAQKPSNPDKFRILTYGLIITPSNARAIIENKWNMEFYQVAGCVVTNELEDCVQKENEKTYQLIEARYGKDWKKAFEEEIANEYRIETYIDSLVRKQPYVADNVIRSSFADEPFPMFPLDNEGNYIVKVNIYRRNWKEIKLYELQVNYKTNTVKIVKDYTAKK